MQLNVSDIVTLYRPEKCVRRVFLQASGTDRREPTEWELLLEELGRRHEQLHLTTFKGLIDVSSGNLDERIELTSAAISDKAPTIYQGVFQARLPGSDSFILGIPDFLIRENEGYTIRECKLARHADEKNHPEILRQLELYAWLFEQTCGERPIAIEAFLGSNELVRIESYDYSDAFNELAVVRQAKGQGEEPYAPVGWSKCSHCRYRQYCWSKAEEDNSVDLVYGVDQGAAIALNQIGTRTIKELLRNFHEDTLAELKRPYGKRMQKIGKSATSILEHARALDSGKIRQVSTFDFPAVNNLVMFDLEGMPPQIDDLDKVYLWGMQVFGESPSEYLSSTSSFDEEGDREGWFQFLRLAKPILNAYPEIPFVHWAHYEPTKIRLYMERYGDQNGIANRVLNSCVDLLPLTKSAFVLPLHSYSLKMVERLAGYDRTMDEFGGEWSMAQYIRAVESKNPDLRAKVMDQILKYNEEDLAATWAVLQWLKRLSS